jgi:ribosomal protein L30E
MNAVAPVTTITQPAGFVHSVDPTKVKDPALLVNTNFPETVAGTVREYTKFTPGQVLEFEGAKVKVHEVTEQRLVLKFVNKQR